MNRYGPYYEGPVRPRHSCLLSGTVVGDLIAAPGVEVEMTGIVTGRLIVEAGGSGTVWGQVWVGVTNCGGQADVFGAVGFTGRRRR
jgi:hypothetical protein